MPRHIGRRRPAAKARAALAAAALLGAAAPDRPHALLAQLTPAEKQTLLHGIFAVGPARPAAAIGSAGYVPGVPRLGIPALQETDASLGITNPLDTRPHDGATALPAGLALAASWDPDLAAATGATLGREAAARGFNLLLGPGLNLVRDPRGGRGFEYLGEDPLLAGTLAGAEIRGIQAQHVIATAKHFAANDFENARLLYDVRASWPDLRQSDLLAFEIALEQGHPGAVMCAYNRLTGPYACENPELLTGILRGDWHFPGFVLSDWGAVHGTAALQAGLDQESAESFDARPYFAAPLTAALAASPAARAAADQAVLRILTAMDQAGLLDPRPRPAEDAAAGANHARQEAAAGIVLLRNAHAILPLAAPATILVVGGGADAGVQAGGGSAEVTPRGGPARRTTLSGDGTGFPDHVAELIGPSPLARLRAAFPRSRVTFTDGRYPEDAARRAAMADTVIVFATNWSTEAEDLPALDLPQGQDTLIARVAAANPRTIVVLETGGAVAMPWRDATAAILEAWYPGQGGADAIAGILSGATEPGGHLPVTFPASAADLPQPSLPNAEPNPATAAPVSFPEGADAGYRWFARTGHAPLYPFGFGLTYSSVTLTNLRASVTEGLTATFDVTNTGTRPAEATPQLYLRGRHVRLLAWQKRHLAPGETAHVTLHPDARLLAAFDGGWNIPAGRVTLGAGFDAQLMAASVSVDLPGGRLPP